MSPDVRRRPFSVPACLFLYALADLALHEGGREKDQKNQDTGLHLIPPVMHLQTVRCAADSMGCFVESWTSSLPKPSLSSHKIIMRTSRNNREKTLGEAGHTSTIDSMGMELAPRGGIGDQAGGMALVRAEQ